MIFQQSFNTKTPGRGLVNITSQIDAVVSESKLANGICHIFIHHTSASLIICENADQTVQDDLERFMGRLVPDGDRMFSHVFEGPDDMPAHIRTILTQSSLSIPVMRKVLALGTWQGLFLWEHRLGPHNRKVTVTVLGE